MSAEGKPIAEAIGHRNRNVTISGAISIAALGFITPIMMIAAALWSIFDSSGNGPHRVSRFWAWTLIKVCRTRVILSGAENLEPDGTYIFAANHSSAFDILVVMAYLPCQFRWMAKEELFQIPFFGPLLGRLGHIPVNRTNPREGVKSLKRAAERIKAGTSVVIFPEGTRSDDGEVLEFKRGGFTLASKAGRPIVPVSISGSHKVLKSNTFQLKPGRIKITIGKPIPTEGKDRGGLDELSKQVRGEITDNLDPKYHLN